MPRSTKLTVSQRLRHLGYQLMAHLRSTGQPAKARQPDDPHGQTPLQSVTNRPDNPPSMDQPSRVKAVGQTLAGIALIGVSALLHEYHNETHLIDLSQRKLEQLADVGATTTMSLLKRNELLITELIRNYVRSPQAFTETLAMMEKLNASSVFEVMIVDSKGRIRFVTHENSPAWSSLNWQRLHNYLRGKNNDPLQISETTSNSTDQQRYAYIGRRFELDGADAAPGAIVVAMDPDQKFAGILGLRHSVGGNVILFRKDGRAVASADASSVAVFRQDHNVAVIKGLIEKQPTRAVLPGTPSGNPSLLAWRDLTPYPFTLLVSTEEEKALRSSSPYASHWWGTLLVAFFWVLINYWHHQWKLALFKAHRQQQRQIAQINASREETETARRALQALAHHQESQREKERKRIARDIHDDLGQQLSATRMQLAMLRRSGLGDNSPETDSALDNLKAGIDNCIESMRKLAHGIREPALEISLAAAIEGLVNDFGEAFASRCTFDNRLPKSLVLPENVTINAYRIVQESLTNIVRHARASEVAILLDQVDGHLLIDIRDNGIGGAPIAMEIGAKPPDIRQGYGIQGMHERAAACGGKLEIHSTPEQGTRVLAWLGIDQGAAVDIASDQHADEEA
ncbi:MAG: sensor histidine kinase [Porticoccaceae bacterium]